MGDEEYRSDWDSKGHVRVFGTTALPDRTKGQRWVSARPSITSFRVLGTVKFLWICWLSIFDVQLGTSREWWNWGRGLILCGFIARNGRWKGGNNGVPSGHYECYLVYLGQESFTVNIKCVYKDNVITWAKSGGGQRKLYLCWDIVEGESGRMKSQRGGGPFNAAIGNWQRSGKVPVCAWVSVTTTFPVGFNDGQGCWSCWWGWQVRNGNRKGNVVGQWMMKRDPIWDVLDLLIKSIQLAIII